MGAVCRSLVGPDRAGSPRPPDGADDLDLHPGGTVHISYRCGVRLTSWSHPAVSAACAGSDRDGCSKKSPPYKEAASPGSPMAAHGDAGSDAFGGSPHRSSQEGTEGYGNNDLDGIIDLEGD